MRWGTAKRWIGRQAPDPTGKSGFFLGTDGSILVWGEPEGGGGSVPEYILIQSTPLAEGDQSIAGPAAWTTDRIIIKEMRIWTSATKWDLWLLQNDNGLVTDDAKVPAIQLMSSGSGNETIFVDRPFEDEDASGRIHLNFEDKTGSNTFTVSVVATELA